jgi:hypothetical protein
MQQYLVFKNKGFNAFIEASLVLIYPADTSPRRARGLTGPNWNALQLPGVPG